MFIVPISQVQSLFPTEGTQQVAAQGAAASIPFVDVLRGAMQNMQETQAVSSEFGHDLALGDSDNLHAGQIASVKAATAVEFAVGLGSRAINAYNEILRMQI